MHGDRRALGADGAIRFLACASQGMRHSGPSVAFDLRRMAVQASTGPTELARRSLRGKLLVILRRSRAGSLASSKSNAAQKGQHD